MSSSFQSPYPAQCSNQFSLRLESQPRIIPQPKVRASPPPMISYDPQANLSDDDEEEDYDAPNPVKQGDSIKKRKSSANLRSNSTTSIESAGNKKSSNEDDESEVKGGSTRRKITIEYIKDRPKRHTTFSKRKSGIMKKVLLLVVSESGWVYTFTTDNFKSLVKEDANGNLSDGQKLISACLEPKAAGETKPAGRRGAPNTGSSESSSFEVATGSARPPRPIISRRRETSKTSIPLPTLAPLTKSVFHIDPVALDSPLSPDGITRSLPQSPINANLLLRNQPSSRMASSDTTGPHNSSSNRGYFDPMTFAANDARLQQLHHQHQKELLYAQDVGYNDMFNFNSPLGTGFSQPIYSQASEDPLPSPPIQGSNYQTYEMTSPEYYAVEEANSPYIPAMPNSLPNSFNVDPSLHHQMRAQQVYFSTPRDY